MATLNWKGLSGLDWHSYCLGKSLANKKKIGSAITTFQYLQCNTSTLSHLNLSWFVHLQWQFYPSKEYPGLFGISVWETQMVKKELVLWFRSHNNHIKEVWRILIFHCPSNSCFQKYYIMWREIPEMLWLAISIGHKHCVAASELNVQFSSTELNSGTYLTRWLIVTMYMKYSPYFVSYNRSVYYFSRMFNLLRSKRFTQFHQLGYFV